MDGSSCGWFLLAFGWSLLAFCVDISASPRCGAALHINAFGSFWVCLPLFFSGRLALACVCVCVCVCVCTMCVYVCTVWVQCDLVCALHCIGFWLEESGWHGTLAHRPLVQTRPSCSWGHARRHHSAPRPRCHAATNDDEAYTACVGGLAGPLLGQEGSSSNGPRDDDDEGGKKTSNELQTHKPPPHTQHTPPTPRTHTAHTGRRALLPALFLRLSFRHTHKTPAEKHGTSARSIALLPTPRSPTHPPTHPPTPHPPKTKKQTTVRTRSRRCGGLGCWGCDLGPVVASCACARAGGACDRPGKWRTDNAGGLGHGPKQPWRGVVGGHPAVLHGRGTGSESVRTSTYYVLCGIGVGLGG